MSIHSDTDPISAIAHVFYYERHVGDSLPVFLTLKITDK